MHGPSVGPTRLAPVRSNLLAVIAMACVVAWTGVLVGRSVAIDASYGGFAALGALATLALTIGAALVVAAVSLGLAHRRFGRAAAALRPIMIAAGALAGGIVIGQASASGDLYVRPVTLHASGTARAELSGGALKFVPSASGTADCASTLDGRIVGHISALDLGVLGEAEVWAAVGLERDRSGSTRGAIFVGREDEIGMPAWTGAMRIDERNSDGTAGRVSFSNLIRQPDGRPASSDPVPWPASLSGTISWACGPWATPGAR